MKDKTLALAGVMQGLKLAQRAANVQETDEEALQASLASVFRIDADSVEDVYGSPRLMRLGLETLVHQFTDGDARDPLISRMGVTVLHIERQLVARPDLLRQIGAGIADAQRQREHFGILHPTVLARLGDIYANSVSTLSTRVLVNGDPEQLRQPAVVAHIRGCLLAAVRSAVLWRQIGGAWWQLILKRRAIVETARSLIPRAE
jgi:high frequency lysogenization protein